MPQNSYYMEKRTLSTALYVDPGSVFQSVEADLMLFLRGFNGECYGKCPLKLTGLLQAEELCAFP